MILTGIGSRRTPKNILSLMSDLGVEAVEHDHIIRSGGAAGADTAFEVQARNRRPDKVEVFLPWPGFNGNTSQFTTPSAKAIMIASNLLPYWSKLAPSVQSLHARNMHQVIGRDCNTLSDVIVCWTPDGASSYEECTKHTGGTGSAIKLASLFSIPIINMQRHTSITTLQQIIDYVDATRIQTDTTWD